MLKSDARKTKFRETIVSKTSDREPMPPRTQKTQKKPIVSGDDYNRKTGGDLPVRFLHSSYLGPFRLSVKGS
jgi:hypothetical protein